MESISNVLIVIIVIASVVLLWCLYKIANQETVQSMGKNTYKKLSVFGKFVLFGLGISMWMLRTGMNSIHDVHISGAQLISSVGSIGIILFIICFICAFFDSVYCEYEYQQGMENGLFSVSGRISRADFLKYFLCLLVAYGIYAGLSFDIGFYVVILIPVQIAFLTAAVRRSQDCGDNPWVPLIPIYSLFLFFAHGDDEENEYGPAKSKNHDIRKTKI